MIRECLKDYPGEVWWLPLNERIRATQFNEKKFFDFLFKQDGKAYDTSQAVKSALDMLDRLPFGISGPTLNKEDFSKFFCSELGSVNTTCPVNNFLLLLACENNTAALRKNSRHFSASERKCHI